MKNTSDTSPKNSITHPKKKSGLTSSLLTKIKTNESLIKPRFNTPKTLPVHLECVHMPSFKKYVLAIKK